MTYTWKQLAELLGVSERSVRRSVKKLGIEGTLSDREEGGTVRVFSEVDAARLKALSARPNLPALRAEEPESGLTTALTNGLTTALTNGLTTALDTLGNLRAELAELPALRAQVGQVTAGLEALREQGEKNERTLREQGEQTERTLRALAQTQEALVEELRAVREELGRPWWERLFKPGRQV
jgi:DNA-binding GntR family transcriptional regulator